VQAAALARDIPNVFMAAPRPRSSACALPGDRVASPDRCMLHMPWVRPDKLPLEVSVGEVSRSFRGGSFDKFHGRRHTATAEPASSARARAPVARVQYVGNDRHGLVQLRARIPADLVPEHGPDHHLGTHAKDLPGRS
jgi:hypothetical protein